MISLERSLPVNPPGTTSPISRSEVWKGLVMKADNALPFVPSMTHCQVLEREGPNQFVREIEFKGERMKERITLEPEKKVTFERLSGSVRGTIRNFIDEDADGLKLRFAFDLELEGVPAGDPREKDYAATMEKAYTGAVDATLGAIRKIHEENQMKIPDWVKTYFGHVDAMRMKDFIAQHNEDAKVYYGNNPPAEGVKAIEGAIGGLWSAINGLSHDFRNVWETGNTAVLESKVTYHRKDGKSVTVPCVTIVERKNDKVQELRIHIDMAPVFA